MNLATPFLICSQNEEFRSLLREMLTKHGFFHVIEARNAQELMEMMGHEKKSHFIIVQSELIDEKMSSVLSHKEDFIVLAHPADNKALPLTARFGVKKFMSFPFSSQRLLEKIQQIAQ